MSATWVDNTGCRADGSLKLGLLTVNAFAIGDPCRIAFGSTNDAARLRSWQRDQQAPALESSRNTYTPRTGSTTWFTIASTGTGEAWVGGRGGPGEPLIRFEYTDDGGATWTPQTSCPGATYPTDMRAVSSDLIYFISNNRVCRHDRTTDTPGVWTTVHNAGATGHTLTRMDMVDATHGWIVGGSAIHSTTNGTSWAPVATYTAPTFDYLASVSATPGGTIVIAGRKNDPVTSNYGAVVSTDNGVTWTSTVLATGTGPDTSGVYGALAVDDDTMLVATPKGTFRSTDGGATWNPATISIFTGEPLTQADGTIIAPVSGDLLKKSTNGGATWTDMPLGTGVSLHTRQVATSDPNELWLAGYGDRRMRSSDNGASFSSVTPPKPSYRTALGWSARNWIIAGENGTIRRTDNAGTSYTDPDGQSTTTFQDSEQFPGGIGVLVGEGDVVRRTTDHGATWSTITTPVAASWLHLERDEDETLWAVGTGGRVISSTTRGASWTAETPVSGGVTLTALSVWDDTIWVGGASGRVWRADTSSRPLVWHSRDTARTGTVSGLWAIDAQTAVALTSYEAAATTAHVSRTTNGGTGWTSSASPIKVVDSISVDDEHRRSWINGSSGELSGSEDLGMTWSLVDDIGVNAVVQDTEVIGPSRLLIVGDTSTIVTTEPTASIPDGMGGAGSGFGTCVEGRSVATLTWSYGGPGGCTAGAPASVWNPIVASYGDAGTDVATSASGTPAWVDLRFGLRTGPSQAATSYSASIVFEAIALN